MVLRILGSSVLAVNLNLIGRFITQESTGKKVLSIVYTKYLVHNSGSTTEMMINITLADDFLTFNILNIIAKLPSPVNQITI